MAARPQLVGWGDSLIGLVNIVDGHDGKIAVVPEVPQDDLLACLQAELIDLGLGHVQGDGHGEEKAIGQAVLFYDSVSSIVLDDAVG